MSSRTQGQLGELEAARFLRQAGYTILASNFRCRVGEIDLIARQGQTLVFVEVKTRAPGSVGRPQDAVTAAKQHKIVEAAALYLARHTHTGAVRFDVVEVVREGSAAAPARIHHIPGAFEAGDGHAFL